ncbi:hypothetical protein B9Z55_017469 [Caenorhabditis nigoni]|uniref:SEA domain-containing protein n=1 Tax=Caenorhabditis nigoni TaxID=1611254 RepID=A0A2G5T996_9PELO|nr:hypothetical protein B9Z55_017469 [Caenorhabditis nigoni]
MRKPSFLIAYFPLLVFSCGSFGPGGLGHSSQSAKFDISFFAPLSYTYPPTAPDFHKGQSLSKDLAFRQVRADLNSAIVRGLTANQIYLYMPPKLDIEFTPQEMKIDDKESCTEDGTYVEIEGTVVYKCESVQIKLTTTPRVTTTTRKTPSSQSTPTSVPSTSSTSSEPPSVSSTSSSSSSTSTSSSTPTSEPSTFSTSSSSSTSEPSTFSTPSSEPSTFSTPSSEPSTFSTPSSEPSTSSTSSSSSISGPSTSSTLFSEPSTFSTPSSELPTFSTPSSEPSNFSTSPSSSSTSSTPTSEPSTSSTDSSEPSTFSTPVSESSTPPTSSSTETPTSSTPSSSTSERTEPPRLVKKQKSRPRRSASEEIKPVLFVQSMTVTATTTQFLTENQWKNIGKSVQKILEDKRWIFEEEMDVVLL